MNLADACDIEFWRSRYRSGRTPWDLGQVSDPVRTLVERWFPPAGRVYIPGCGRGYEALYLAERGYAVTAVDIAPEPIASLRQEARQRGLALDIREGDLFALSRQDEGAFDVFLEQTCLCALPPRRQPDYAALAYRALKPGGQVLAVLMRVPFADGPPFDLPPERLQTLFPAPLWQREGPWPVEPPNPARPGPEYLARCVRLAGAPAREPGEYS